MIILSIFLFAIVLLIDVITDYKRVDTNNINHIRGGILRSIGLLPTVGFLLFPLDNTQFGYIVIKLIIIIGMLASWWWEFFDGFLNFKRGKSWRFNGSDDPNDAHSDDFLQEFSPIQQAIIKWSLIVGFTFMYTLI